MMDGERGERDALQRAEELVERVTNDVGAFATRLLARAREEAEDVWAEARAVRDRGPRDGPQD